MKKFPLISLRFYLLAGLTANFLVFSSSAPLFADDHGGHHEPGGNKTEFLGTIQSLPSGGLIGGWTVDGRVVVVTAATLIRVEVHGVPVVGGKVEVEGPTFADGSVQATSIKTEGTTRELEDDVFFGPVQALPTTGATAGIWLVGGLRIVVNDATRIESEGAALVVGALVRVEGTQQADASIVASEIEIQ